MFVKKDNEVEYRWYPTKTTAKNSSTCTIHYWCTVNRDHRWKALLMNGWIKKTTIPSITKQLACHVHHHIKKNTHNMLLGDLNSDTLMDRCDPTTRWSYTPTFPFTTVTAWTSPVMSEAFCSPQHFELVVTDNWVSATDKRMTVYNDLELTHHSSAPTACSVLGADVT